MYGILIFLGAVFIYTMRRRNNLEKQVELFNRLLYIEKSPERYILEVEKLLGKVQSEKERNINLIQKTTGLFYLGKFDDAIEILVEEITKIPPNWQSIYYHNLLLSLYFNNDTERANSTLNEVKSTLDMYYKKDYNKITIELIYAIADFFNGDTDKHKEFFNNLSAVSKNEYRVALGYYFMSQISEFEHKHEDAEEYLEKARMYGHGSFIEKL